MAMRVAAGKGRASGGSSRLKPLPRGRRDPANRGATGVSRGGTISQGLTRDIAGNIVYSTNAAAKRLEAMRRHLLAWRLDQLQTVAQQHGID